MLPAAVLTYLLLNAVPAVPGDNPLRFHSPGGDMFFTVYENDLGDDGDDTMGLDPDEERAVKTGTANGGVKWTSASYTFTCEPEDGGSFYYLVYENGKPVEMIPY